MTSNSLQKLMLIGMAILFTFILNSSVGDKIKNLSIVTSREIAAIER